MKYFAHIVCVILAFTSCSKDAVTDEHTLKSTISNREIVLDNVIACAASNLGSTVVSVFLYPRAGVSNIRYFETKTTMTDKNDHSNYREGNYPLTDVLNGFLKKFDIEPQQEKWIIVTFEEDNKVHLSNPIRLKQLTKATEFLPENIMVDKSALQMPVFSWVDGTHTDTEIYFEIVSDVAHNLFSGTYTYEKLFQYYNLSNVVLNVTVATPPELMENNTYNFTLMGVSEDNWVNMWSEVSFEL